VYIVVCVIVLRFVYVYLVFTNNLRVRSKRLSEISQSAVVTIIYSSIKQQKHILISWIIIIILNRSNIRLNDILLKITDVFFISNKLCVVNIKLISITLFRRT